MYEHELHVACLAVKRASILTQKVFHNQAKGITSKEDQSPVTIGDYGAQALIIHALKQFFPDDEVVGEEDAQDLRQDSKLAQRIWDLVRTTRLSGQDELGHVGSDAEMLAAIDSGNSVGGRAGRIWALDPIDGTKGFIRGGQYAVCLALLVDGQVVVGVLACPNLPFSGHQDEKSGASDGTLFKAIIGQGSTHCPLYGSPAEDRKSTMRDIVNVRDAVFCESVEAAHSSHDHHAAVAERLGIASESVRMDSQAKYGSIARGSGDVYLRLPVRAGYEEKIWDHAAGDLIVREAHGFVTDIDGRRLDFGCGRTLKSNKGVVAAPSHLHPEVLEAVQFIVRS